MPGNITLSKEKKDALDLKLASMIDSATLEKGRISRRWKKQRSQYGNEATPFVSFIMKGVQDKCFPYTQPLGDTLADNVMMAVFSQDPVVSVANNGGGGADTKSVEDCLKLVMRRGKYEAAVRTVLDDVFCTNHGILHMSLDADEMLFRFDPVPPEDFLVLGSACYNLETADMAGHAFYPTVGEVLDRISAGEYYKQDVGYAPKADAMDAAESDTQMVDPSESTETESLPTKIYSVSFTCDLASLGKERSLVTGQKSKKRGKTETYIAHYDLHAKTTLSLRPAPSRRHWYFSFGYLPRPTRGFWCDRSVARNLQDLHDAYQMANNILLYGHIWSAFKPVISRGPFNKSQTITPGGMITSMGAEMSIPNLDFDPAQMPFVIQNLEKIGQGAVRISQAGMAMQSTQKKTATQVEDEAQGQAIGRSGYVSTFSEAPTEMAREMILQMKNLWQEFKDAHGSALPDAPPQGQPTMAAGLDPMAAGAGMPMLDMGGGAPGMGQPDIAAMNQDPMPPPVPEGIFPFGEVRDMEFDITGSAPSMNPQFQFARASWLLEQAAVYPEINRREALETAIAAIQMRNGSKILYTPEQMAAIQQQEQLLQIKMAMAQGLSTPGAGESGGPSNPKGGASGAPTDDPLAPGGAAEAGMLAGLRGVTPPPEMGGSGGPLPA